MINVLPAVNRFVLTMILVVLLRIVVHPKIRASLHLNILKSNSLCTSSLINLTRSYSNLTSSSKIPTSSSNNRATANSRATAKNRATAMSRATAKIRATANRRVTVSSSNINQLNQKYQATVTSQVLQD